MAKKNTKSKKFSDAEGELDSAIHAETAGESTSSDLHPQDDAVPHPTGERMPVGLEDESSSEDLLDDVRRALIEEDETDRSKKESKWWRRIGRKEKSSAPEPPSPNVEIDLPAASLQPDEAEDQPQTTETDELGEQIDDLISILETEHQPSDRETTSAVEVEIPADPEPAVDFEQIKEQAFRPRTGEDADSDVRSIALEDGEEVFVEVEVQAADPFDERLKSVENALKPYRSYIYMTLAFLGAVMAVVASLLIYNAYQQSRPEPVKEVSNLPYPIAVGLPGGWSFNLGRGTLEGGEWHPAGAEWLEGTEVCRWVSLPWSRQLEAVLRTLNPQDPIELVMSNNDKLIYGVYSVHEMTSEEIHKLDANSPCLLLILTESDSEKRWVLTALP